MADTMQFDLVSPERSLASLQVTAVQIPGADGDLTAMPNHAPLITTLRPGILTVEGAQGTEKYAVTGGFAEIGESLSVLAERALPVAEVTQDILDSFVTDAVNARDNATPEMLDALAKQVTDIAAMAAELGLQAKT
ncbi:F0F1 ATP synthase subunit epsilon [Aliisedimentitalea scapharcae]|uniref:ATP synthase epsilon chain n=1 Tax=Aliisedimentitalea scapharcae TaxID=1524259 RepID=A0ABZ2Y0B5_9RHOB|nr:F0F1 ATP synthase subunit epsilon [Rhodobacteraceae bacterium M382]